MCKFCSFIILSLLINTVILLLNYLVLILYHYIHFLSVRRYSVLKHYLDLYITDTALKVSQSLYCFTTSISHGVENYRYFPRLWGTDMSDAIFNIVTQLYMYLRLLVFYLVVVHNLTLVFIFQKTIHSDNKKVMWTRFLK